MLYLTEKEKGSQFLKAFYLLVARTGIEPVTSGL